METTPTDVLQNSSPAVSENVTTQPSETLPEVAIVEPTTLPTGSKTPSENLYAALAEERRLRKEAEDKLLQAETSILPDTDDVYSDEGKVLKTEISKLQETVTRLEDERQLERTIAQFPALKDFTGEFDSFRKEYPRHKPENVAKLFLTEKGLLAETRMGLEKQTGGSKEPQKSGFTTDEIADLRKNNFRKYQQMLQDGKLRGNDIK